MSNWKSLENTIRAARQKAMLEYMVEEIELDEVIMNSNSSGQGYDPDHSDHPFHSTIVRHGYSYSHSTPIRHLDGSQIIHHTYKHVNNRDKNVTVHKPKDGGYRWATSTSGSGRRATSGWHSTALEKHLKGRKIVKKTNHNDLKEDADGQEDIRPVDHNDNRVDSLPNNDQAILENTETSSIDESYAVARAAKLKKEEVEQVDEISKAKLASYVKQAQADTDIASGELGRRNAEYARGNKAAIAGAAAIAAKHLKRKMGIHKALDKMVKEDEVEEAISPTANKLDAQRQQLQKQKDAVKMSIAKQKGQKELAALKQKGQQELQKIKEDDQVDESFLTPSYGRAAKLQRLHTMRAARLAQSGDMKGAELHRKKANEWKRQAYMATNNPLKSVQS